LKSGVSRFTLAIARPFGNIKVMELRLSNTARSSPTGFVRLAVVLARLLASGFLPLSVTGAQAALPVESQAPCDDGGQESESVKSGAVRTVTPTHSHSAPAFHRERPRATDSRAVRSCPSGRPSRLFVLRC
jgi:hypothetical protein